MKKYLLVILTVLPLSLAHAQESDLEKPEDAFATWTDIIVRKDFSNWHVGGLVEYCTIDKGQGLKNNEMLIRPVVGYNPLPWLRFQLQVDFLYSFYSQFNCECAAFAKCRNLNKLKQAINNSYCSET